MKFSPSPAWGISICHFSENHSSHFSYFIKGFREKIETAIKIEEEIAQLFAFYVLVKEFYVDAFLGSDENKFRSDEKSQLATIKRTSLHFWDRNSDVR